MVLKTCLESFKVIAEQTQEKILIVIENCDWKLWLKIACIIFVYFTMGLKAADKFHFLLSGTAIKWRVIS